MSRLSGLTACAVLGVVLAAGAAYSAGLADLAPDAATTAPAVRVERIPVSAKQAEPLAKAIRQVLASRPDADAFVVAADPTSGCILLSGPPGAVDDVIRVMGVRTQPLLAGRPARCEDETVVRVLALEQTTCKSVARTLHEAFRREPCLVVAANEDRNAIILRGDAAVVTEAERIVAALESDGLAGDVHSAKIIRLKHAEAERVVGVLGELLGRSGDVTCDERTNSLIVSAPPELLKDVARVVAELDVVIEPKQGRERGRADQRRRGDRIRPQERTDRPAPVPQPEGAQGASPDAPSPVTPDEPDAAPSDRPAEPPPASPSELPAGDEPESPTRTR